MAPTKLQVAHRFLQPLFEFLQTCGRIVILDAGCGDGVHVDLITTTAGGLHDSTLVAADLSATALRAARSRQDAQWQFVQGDVGSLPFRDGICDAVFSYGVLGYTRDPAASFAELCRVTARNGMVGIWVYPRAGLVGATLFAAVRKLCRLSGPVGTRVIADCIVPFLDLLPTRSQINLANATWHQCREVVLVNISPRVLFFPTVSEVEGWFAANGVPITHRDDAVPITLWGRKT